MNILVVSQYYYPEQFRVTDICESLVRCGHSVTVIAGIPNYPEGEVFSGYEDSYKKVEIHNGVRIIRCKNKPRHQGTVSLAINYISYVTCANRIVRKLHDKFDLVYVYQMSPITMAIPAIVYKKKHKVPLYIYVLDIWPESFRDKGNSKMFSEKNPFFVLVKAISSWIYKSADCLGVKCNAFIDYLVDICGVERSKCSLLHEHAESNYLSISKNPVDNGCVDFMFLGNIGHSSNCLTILKAAELLSDVSSYKIHFVGDGSDLEELKSYANTHNLSEKVVFHGRVPQSEVMSFYDYADVCLLTLSNKSAIGVTPPGKMYGYMAAARPIISSASNVVNFELEKIGCGIGTNPDDVTSLANAMQYAIDNPAELLAMGIKGREYFKENYTIDKHLEGLEAHFKKICTDK